MFVSLLAAGLLGLASHADPCGKALPRGPTVPAAIILRTTCGDLRLAPDGRVSRLRRRWLHDWLAAHPTVNRPRFGRGLAIRRNRAGRISVVRGKNVVWRSSRLYPNDGGDMAFGPRGLAFASYRRGVFLTDLHGPERLVVPGRSFFPHAFTNAGELLVSSPRGITVVSPEGVTLRRHRYRLQNGIAFDEKIDTLYFVNRHGWLAAARGAKLRILRPLRRVEGGISIGGPDLLVFDGGRHILVTRRDGTSVARAHLPRKLSVNDSGFSVAPDDRAIAFRMSNARAGARSGAAMVYVLRPGDTRAQPVFWDQLGPTGCAAGATLSWHERSLLYRAIDGELAVIDGQGRGARRLTRFARSLPGTTTFVYWAADFGR